MVRGRFHAAKAESSDPEGALGLTKTKVFIVWPFSEKVCLPLTQSTGLAEAEWKSCCFPTCIFFFPFASPSLFSNLSF